MSADAKFEFDGLFIFEVANNHQGSPEHGVRIIQEVGRVAREAGIRAAVKLQFRDLDTFIHPAFRASAEPKHIQRFLSTRLTRDQFGELLDTVRGQGMVTMVTPFDERSVELLLDLEVEVIKIGSSSAKDWPLLESAAAARRPMVVSTGGLTLADVDNLVSFLDHRYVHFALMHCVALYPTPLEAQQLNQIALFRARYPSTPIGFSTHEDPENVHLIQMAYAKGARLFERHIGVPTATIKLNAYSSTPQQLRSWIEAYRDAVAACGSGEGRPPVPAAEAEELRQLMRGVYARRSIKRGETLGPDDVFFAMPLQEGQMTSGQWRDGVAAAADYALQAPLPDGLVRTEPTKMEIIYQTIHEVKGMLNTARIAIGSEFDVELSHHYGIERFREVGVTIIDCINRDYCKKILIQLPGQIHPLHHHRKKEETFQVLAGRLEVEVEGRRRTLHPGDTLLVQRGVRHRFWTDEGAIVEEVSTTHFDDDSMYEDPAITVIRREDRKTKLVNWGRHQFD
jgi:N-acetylneuraminate synthase